METTITGFFRRMLYWGYIWNKRKSNKGLSFLSELGLSVRSAQGFHGPSYLAASGCVRWYDAGYVKA